MAGEDGEVGPVAWIRYGKDNTRQVEVGRLGLRHFKDSVPWRAVRSRHGQQHLPGSYWSSTMGGYVIYESRLELARLLLADFDPDVVEIRAQPCWLKSRVDGRMRRHVPDFLLSTRRGAVRVVNVKPAERLGDPKIAQALAWPGKLFESRGWGYEIWSGCERTVLENIRFLAGYRRPVVVDQEVVARVSQVVQDGDELVLAERRLAHDAPPGDVRPALLSLLWSGRLVTDLGRPLGGRSVLRKCA